MAGERISFLPQLGSHNVSWPNPRYLLFYFEQNIATEYWREWLSPKADTAWSLSSPRAGLLVYTRMKIVVVLHSCTL